MEKIATFLSIGKPHNSTQKNYRDSLVEYLNSKNIIVETLGESFYSNQSPLIPIQQKMEEVHGAIILAMERFHSKGGIYREGSGKQKSVKDQYFTTVWTQIEGAMAYQLKLPLLILKDKNVFAEGMFDPQIHEWRVTTINSSDSGEVSRSPLKEQIDIWIKDVQAYYESKNKINPLDNKISEDSVIGELDISK